MKLVTRCELCLAFKEQIKTLSFPLKAVKLVAWGILLPNTKDEMCLPQFSCFSGIPLEYILKEKM